MEKLGITRNILDKKIKLNEFSSNNLDVRKYVPKYAKSMQKSMRKSMQTSMWKSMDGYKGWLEWKQVLSTTEYKACMQ